MSPRTQPCRRAKAFSPSLGILSRSRDIPTFCSRTLFLGRQTGLSSLHPSSLEPNQRAHSTRQSNDSIIQIHHANCRSRNRQVADIREKLQLRGSSFPVSKTPQSALTQPHNPPDSRIELTSQASSPPPSSPHPHSPPPSPSPSAIPKAYTPQRPHYKPTQPTKPYTPEPATSCPRRCSTS